jgi:NAD-dependent DNA ligase
MGYTRDQLVDRFTAMGGEFTSSVSKRTDYLFHGVDGSGSLKLSSWKSPPLI